MAGVIFRLPKRPLVNLKILNEQEAERERLQNEVLSKEIKELSFTLGEQKRKQEFNAGVQEVMNSNLTDAEKRIKVTDLLTTFNPEQQLQLEEQRASAITGILGLDETISKGDIPYETYQRAVKYGDSSALSEIIATVDKTKSDPRYGQYSKTAEEYKYESEGYLNDLNVAVLSDPNATKAQKDAAISGELDGKGYQALLEYDIKRMGKKSQFAKHARARMTPGDRYSTGSEQIRMEEKIVNMEKMYRDMIRDFSTQNYGTEQMRAGLLPYFNDEDYRDSLIDNAENAISDIQKFLPKELQGDSKKRLTELYGQLDLIRKLNPVYAELIEEYWALRNGNAETWINIQAKKILGNRTTKLPSVSDLEELLKQNRIPGTRGTGIGGTGIVPTEPQKTIEQEANERGWKVR